MEISDFQRVFKQAPIRALLLTPELRILDATDDYRRVTLTEDRDIEGMYVWDAFPDNPADPNAATAREGLDASFEKVRRTLKSDRAPLMKFDIPDETGTFVVRYWQPTNAPILNPDGTLRYIFNLVEDVTVATRAILALRRVGLSLQEISTLIGQLIVEARLPEER